jgi:hypothetical protein
MRGKEAITKIGDEGKRILRRFTAACIAAKNPFAEIKEGGGEECSKLLAKCEWLGLDVLIEGGRWVERGGFVYACMDAAGSRSLD